MIFICTHSLQHIICATFTLLFFSYMLFPCRESSVYIVPNFLCVCVCVGLSSEQLDIIKCFRELAVQKPLKFPIDFIMFSDFLCACAWAPFLLLPFNACIHVQRQIKCINIMPEQGF